MYLFSLSKYYLCFDFGNFQIYECEMCAVCWQWQIETGMKYSSSAPFPSAMAPYHSCPETPGLPEASSPPCPGVPWVLSWSLTTTSVGLDELGVKWEIRSRCYTEEEHISIVPSLTHWSFSWRQESQGQHKHLLPGSLPQGLKSSCSRRHSWHHSLDPA